MLKTILSVIYEFSYKARVFVRLGWKILQGTYTPAITIIRELRTKKVLEHWPQGSILNMFFLGAYE